MQKSFIERVFPKPKKAILPQHDEYNGYRDAPQSSKSPRTTSIGSFSESRSSGKSNETNVALQSAPISASVIHHEDPFLAVDRAAQNLQNTIQSLLDFQNEALNGRHEYDKAVPPHRSLTPSHSTINHSLRSISGSGAVPIRQPVKKKVTLRNVRIGIGKSMQEFAVLKEEELKITRDEQAHRRTALDRIEQFESKRNSVLHELSILQERSPENESSVLRQEAQTVENEIRELEGRLMELKARHRHIISCAEQLESSAASETSSYQGALALIDKDVRSFLRQPPVRQSLGARSLQQGQDMFSLRPERRTLALAKEQWNTELDTLEQHQTETVAEKDALIEGSHLWRNTVQKIDAFEQNLRTSMKSGASDPTSMSDVVSSLESTMQSLQESLNQAEAKNWKLLICAIGSELEAFQQARAILMPEVEPKEITPDHLDDNKHNVGLPADGSTSVYTDEEDNDVPHADLLGEQSPTLSSHALPTPSTRWVPAESNHDADLAVDKAATSCASDSNESLKATLRDISTGADSRNRQTSTPLDNSDIGIKSSSSVLRSRSQLTGTSTSNGKQTERRSLRSSESDEDDDPGPDFLLSH